MVWPLDGRTYAMRDLYKERLFVLQDFISLASLPSVVIGQSPSFSTTMIPSMLSVKHLIKERMAIIHGESSSKIARTIKLGRFPTVACEPVRAPLSGQGLGPSAGHRISPFQLGGDVMASDSCGSSMWSEIATSATSRPRQHIWRTSSASPLPTSSRALIIA